MIKTGPSPQIFCNFRTEQSQANARFRGSARGCSHVPFFGGSPRVQVPDNLKSGVNKVSVYAPEINRTYGAMAAHYSIGIRPTLPSFQRHSAG